MEVQDENSGVFERNEHIRPNRKRKKGVLENARKYGRKGMCGRGNEVSDDTYHYFINVLELLKTGFSSREEEEIFANNVLKTTNNEEVNYSRNQVGCRVIEALLPKADDETLERFFEAFNNDLRLLVSDRFASFVIQKLLYIAAYKGASYDPTQDPDQQNKDNDSLKNYPKIYFNFAIKISNFMLNNLEDFIWNTCANHIMRTAIETLSGKFIPDSPQPQNTTISVTTPFKNIDENALPANYKLVVQEYANRLLQWPQFGDLAYEEKTSGLLQTLIPATQKIDRKLCKSLLKAIREKCFVDKTPTEGTDENMDGSSDTKKIPDVFESDAAVRLLETVLENGTDKIFTKIYTKCFLGHLVALSKQHRTKFTIRKLLDHCKTESEFEAMYDELAPEMQNFLLMGNSLILVSLAKGAKRFGTRQGQFLQGLMDALHCNSPSDRQILVVPLTIKLVQYEQYETAQAAHYFVNIHGSVLVQTMLEFKKPIKIINSILNASQNDLVKLFCDAKGCHVPDKYMSSEFVGEKSREKLIAHLQGSYQTLVGNKYGSRTFDAIWNVAKLPQRITIMHELSNKQALWANTPIGKFMVKKLKVDLFKRNIDEWKTSFNAHKNASKLFEDIVVEKQ